MAQMTIVDNLILGIPREKKIKLITRLLYGKQYSILASFIEVIVDKEEGLKLEEIKDIVDKYKDTKMSA